MSYSSWDKVARVRRRGVRKGFTRSTSSMGLGPPQHVREGSSFMVPLTFGAG